MTTVIHLRGTNEPLNEDGISMTFLNNLDPRFNVEIPAYAADYGLHASFAESNIEGRTKVLELLRTLDGPVILSGYSQGAYIMGTLARDINDGRVSGVMASKIEAVALLADPLRPEGEGADGIPTPSGYGIAGQRPIPDLSVYWGTASHDPISALPADNPLRSVADLSKMFSIDPRDWAEWVADVRHTIETNALQPWWMFWLRPWRWVEALAALNGYLTGRHTNSYLDEGICVRLADVINREVP